MSRESARNISKKIPWSAALNLLAKAPGLQINLETAKDLGGQLLAERREPWQKVRRRSYQAVLGFDVFMKYLEHTRPSFCDIFTDHVASSMHRYSAAMFPSDYEDFEFTEEWVSAYRNEIDCTMGKFDRIFGKLAAFVDANPEYQLWVATSMGQAATRGTPCDSQLYITDQAAVYVCDGGGNPQNGPADRQCGQTNVAVARQRWTFSGNG